MAFINSDDVLLLVDIGDYQLKAEFLLSNSLLDKKMLGEPSKLKKLKFVKKNSQFCILSRALVLRACLRFCLWLGQYKGKLSTNKMGQHKYFPQQGWVGISITF